MMHYLEWEHDVTLSNQTIIEMAYLTKDMIDLTLGRKLCLEEANCYVGCFITCRKLLKLANGGCHQKLREFYRDGRDLVNDGDRLTWVDPITFKPTPGMEELPF
ncbi:MAG: hypothetical protein ABSH06_10065 [Thermodesulfobacteriota bacterium]|jgi:hypothetical protein